MKICRRKLVKRKRARCSVLVEKQRRRGFERSSQAEKKKVPGPKARNEGSGCSASRSGTDTSDHKKREHVPNGRKKNPGKKTRKELKGSSGKEQ